MQLEVKRSIGLREVTRLIVILLRCEELSLLNKRNTPSGYPCICSPTYRHDDVGNVTKLHTASYEASDQDHRDYTRTESTLKPSFYSFLFASKPRPGTRRLQHLEVFHGLEQVDYNIQRRSTAQNKPTTTSGGVPRPPEQLKSVCDLTSLRLLTMK